MFYGKIVKLFPLQLETRNKLLLSQLFSSLGIHCRKAKKKSYANWKQNLPKTADCTIVNKENLIKYVDIDRIGNRV